MSPQDLTLTSTRGEEHLTVNGNRREDKSSRTAAVREGVAGQARVFLLISRFVLCFSVLFSVYGRHQYRHCMRRKLGAMGEEG